MPLFAVTAWWTVQRGTTMDIQARSPKAAVEKVERQLAAGDNSLYSQAEYFDNCDGETCFDVARTDGTLLLTKYDPTEALGAMGGLLENAATQMLDAIAKARDEGEEIPDWLDAPEDKLIAALREIGKGIVHYDARGQAKRPA